MGKGTVSEPKNSLRSTRGDLRESALGDLVGLLIGEAERRGILCEGE